MAGPVADRLYLGDKLIYERGQEHEPAVPVVPFSSPFVLPTNVTTQFVATDSTSKTVTPTTSGHGVAFLQLWEDKEVTAPPGFVEHAHLTHPDNPLLTLIVYSGPVAANTSYTWSWSGSIRSLLRFYTFDGVNPADPVADVQVAPSDASDADTFTPPAQVDSTGKLAVAAYAAQPLGAGTAPYGFPASTSTAGTWFSTTPTGRLASCWFLPVEGMDFVPYPRIGRNAEGGGKRIAAMVVLNRASGQRPAETQSLADTIDALLSPAPGGAWAVLKDGELIASRSWGVTRNDREAEPVTLDTPFDVSSIAKSVTLLAVLKLVDEGLVDLDEPIHTYLADRWPSHSEPRMATDVLVRHVCEMTTGQTNTTYNPTSSLDSEVQAWLNTPVIYEPGMVRVYANRAYSALTGLIEEVSGQRYEDYVRSLLSPWVEFTTEYPGMYKPLMMSLDDPSWSAPLPLDTGGVGATGLWMSVRQLAQLARILRSDLILTPASWSLFWQLFPYPSRFTHYGPRGGALWPNGSWSSGANGMVAGIFRAPDGYDVVYATGAPVTGVTAALLEALVTDE